MCKLFRNILLLVMAVTMTSCGTVGLLVHTAKIYDGNQCYNCGDDVAHDTIHFVINSKNKMLLKAEINGKMDTVMYDSGVNSFTGLMYTPSTKPGGMKFYNHRVSGADKKSKIKVTTLPVKIKTDMVVSEGLGLATLNPEPSACEQESSISQYDIIGFQGLNLSRYMIDFTHNQMYELPDSLCIDTTEFIPIKCKFNMSVLWVYPIINGVEYECIFDTGNGVASFLLMDEQRVEAPEEGDCVYEGSYGQAVGGLTASQHFVCAPKERLSLVGGDKETDVLYVKSISNNNMGLKAIARYDWIIAGWGENPKVYVRPHANDEVKPLKTPAYKVSSSDGTLKIITRRIDGNERFKVGDRIISVNGEKINEENICYYYDLLTEAKDWSEFDVQVK
jgi:hypothetical protein